MSKLNADPSRSSLSRQSTSASKKRQSGLDPSTINAMFPDAAAAIATEKAKFTQQTGNPPQSNRNSTVAAEQRSSVVAPTIAESMELGVQSVSSPWGNGAVDQPIPRPKSSSGHAPMGQFVQPPPSAGLRSPRGQLPGNAPIQSTTLTAGDKSDLPLLSPYNSAGGNWASMVNTPLVPNFSANNQAAGTQADMVANATAMKLAALSTVNNRFALDDVRKYRRARSNDAPVHGQSTAGQSLGLAPANVVMINEHGQVLSREHMLALQAQQAGLSMAGNKSRPSSPGIVMQPGFGPVAFASPQNNGYLSAYDGPPMINNGLGTVGIAQLGMGTHEGYLSDHSDMVRGRSPRGRRGSSKPPEDPTDPSLLQDIPSWLRSLRLHKYTDNLKDMKWTDLIELDDKALEDKGVNALGARRKMLKVFEQVKGTPGSRLQPDSKYMVC